MTFRAGQGLQHQVPARPAHPGAARRGLGSPWRGRRFRRAPRRRTTGQAETPCGRAPACRHVRVLGGGQRRRYRVRQGRSRGWPGPSVSAANASERERTSRISPRVTLDTKSDITR
jgi:hypothetical protein